MNLLLARTLLTRTPLARTATLAWFLLTGLVSQAQNFSETEALFHSGKIAEATEIARGEVERGVWNRRWSELLIRCQMATGRYDEALQTYDAAIKRYPTSVPLRAIGVEVTRYNNLPSREAAEKAVIDRYLQTGQLRFATADTLVAAGRFFSKNGIDARIILKSFFDRVLESDPTHLEALLATSELAISKGDFGVAAETVARAKQRGLIDARLEYLHSLALANSDPPAAETALNESLTLNPVYEPALVLRAEKLIDRELYDKASETIDSILETNSKSPPAIALQAVLAHLRGEYDEEKRLREKALESWKNNPEVDHLIGRKLSDKYRFAEGAAYQRRALINDPKNIPATFQLAQDLLRLGFDDIGWELAEQVNAEDPYNVVAYNLMTLKDRIDGFETIRASEVVRSPPKKDDRQKEPKDDTDLEVVDILGDAEIEPAEPGEILIRMAPLERQVYGDQAARLLAEAKKVLCEKYALELKRPVIVEIFPKQSDFAIRTFGLPGGEGFLGVCFGHVITANSPASQGERPSNWKSVLWHEFCHVVTLTKTKNRMPRWLSEGISVYEERLRDPRWGQSMNAGFREMILGDDFTPIAELSGAFLNPPSPNHLQFAYYESSLVVQYLVETFGIDKVKAVLESLASGVEINQALAMEVQPIERLEIGFAQFAREKAYEFGSDLEFERSDLPEDTPNEQRIVWAKENLDNYWARMLLGQSWLAVKDFKRAAEQFEFLKSKDAATGENSGVLELLARCYRELEDEVKEREALESLFAVSADPLPGLQRYIEMKTEVEDWDSVRTASERALEIQPFSVEIHQARVQACEQLQRREDAIDSLLAIKAMEPIDEAGIEYQLAEAYFAAGETDVAKRHVIDALLVAPRYRDAHRLLAKLTIEKPVVKESEGDAK